MKVLSAERPSVLPRQNTTHDCKYCTGNIVVVRGCRPTKGKDDGRGRGGGGWVGRHKCWSARDTSSCRTPSPSGRHGGGWLAGLPRVGYLWRVWSRLREAPSRRRDKTAASEPGNHGGVIGGVQIMWSILASVVMCFFLRSCSVLRRNQYLPTSTAHLVQETRCNRRDQEKLSRVIFPFLAVLTCLRTRRTSTTIVGVDRVA